MLSGTTPSACASSLLPSLIQDVIRAIDGHKLKYIDITISGLGEGRKHSKEGEEDTMTDKEIRIISRKKKELFEKANPIAILKLMFEKPTEESAKKIRKR